MKPYQKFTRIAIFTFAGVVVALLILTLIYPVWYIQLSGDKYGRKYNEKRIQLNHPIIEDYFVKKVQKNELLTVWSDTTESHVHLDKSYHTNDFGRLLSETDYYRPQVDSAWLKKQLGITDLEQLESWTFNRTYYPDKPDIVYDIAFSLKDGPLTTVEINEQVGDSLFQTLK